MSKEYDELIRGKLTKKFLMDLPDNVFLVSNLFLGRGISAYAEYVAPLSKRNQQWEKIVKASVDQRLCHVFKTKKECEKWLKVVFDKKAD